MLLADIWIFGAYKKFFILFSSKRDAIAICSARAYNVDFIDVLPEIIIDIERGGRPFFTFINISFVSSTNVVTDADARHYIMILGHIFIVDSFEKLFILIDSFI